MEIVFHAHRAVISDDLRARAERAVHKAAARLRRTVAATVRFEEDGPTRRVEIVLRARRRRLLVAAGEARLFRSALAAAAVHLDAQASRAEPPHLRGRRVARTTAASLAAGNGAGDDAELTIVQDALAAGTDEVESDGANPDEPGPA